MTKQLFVFNDAVMVAGCLKLNIRQGCYEVSFDDQLISINIADLQDNSVTMVMYNHHLRKLYCLHNFKQIAELLAMKHADVLTFTQNSAFMQLDLCNGSPFIKVFLPQDQYTLISDTHDFSDNCYVPIEFIHPLDWQYCATYDLRSITQNDGLLSAVLDVVPALYQEQVFLTYGNQVQALQAGENKLALTYCPEEKFYIGRPNSRYQGQSIDVSRYV